MCLLYTAYLGGHGLSRKILTLVDNFREHGCTRTMNVIILASMDALDHGCTRDMNVIIFASMDALDHGCIRDMNVIIWPAWMLLIMDALET